jgi:hypothetical protein
VHASELNARVFTFTASQSVPVGKVGVHSGLASAVLVVRRAPHTPPTNSRMKRRLSQPSPWS